MLNKIYRAIAKEDNREIARQLLQPNLTQTNTHSYIVIVVKVMYLCKFVCAKCRNGKWKYWTLDIEPILGIILKHQALELLNNKIIIWKITNQHCLCSDCVAFAQCSWCNCCRCCCCYFRLLFFLLVIHLKIAARLLVCLMLWCCDIWSWNRMNQHKKKNKKIPASQKSERNV